MIEWPLVLALLSVAAILLCFRFVGCALNRAGLASDDPIPPAPPDYGGAILAEPHLVAYWRLGEPAGTVPGDTAQDEKGGAHPGIYQISDLAAGPQSPETSHPPTLDAGQSGLVVTAPARTSVRVNGGRVQVPFSGALNPQANPGFSVEAWVHPEWSAGETGVFRCVVASRQDTGTQKYGYILYAGPTLDPATFAVVDATMRWQAWVGDGTTWQMVVGPAVDVGLTTYLLVTYDGAGQTLGLDAVNANTDLGTYTQWVKPSTIYSPNPAAGAKPLYIGIGAPELATPRYPFFGRIQEVAVYNDVLSGASAFLQHIQAAGGL